MTFQPRSATSERGCMTLQTKSMEIQPLLTAGWWWIYLSGKMEKTIPAGLGTFLGWYGYK